MSIFVDEDPDDSTTSVYRSDVDLSVWMCNIPAEDVATGIQASRSLRKIKRYVEETMARHSLYGVWVRVGFEHWQYQIVDD